MLEKIKIFGLWLLIIIAVIGATVLPIAYYYNVKYRDVTEYNHGIHAIDWRDRYNQKRNRTPQQFFLAMVCGLCFNGMLANYHVTKDC